MKYSPFQSKDAICHLFCQNCLEIKGVYNLLYFLICTAKLSQRLSGILIFLLKRVSYRQKLHVKYKQRWSCNKFSVPIRIFSADKHQGSYMHIYVYVNQSLVLTEIDSQHQSQKAKLSLNTGHIYKLRH